MLPFLSHSCQKKTSLMLNLAATMRSWYYRVSKGIQWWLLRRCSKGVALCQELDAISHPRRVDVDGILSCFCLRSSLMPMDVHLCILCWAAWCIMYFEMAMFVYFKFGLSIDDKSWNNCIDSKQKMVVLCIGEKGDTLAEDAHSPQRGGNPEVCQVATLAFV